MNRNSIKSYLKLKKQRKRVSVLVLHEDKILGFHARDPHNQKTYFFLPGGMREKGESIEETAIRETLEETGYNIELLKTPRLFRNYDFEWNGQCHDCETWYLIGKIVNNVPKEVNDASYHLGIDWIPVSDVDTTFNYHQDVLEPIKLLLKDLSYIQNVPFA